MLIIWRHNSTTYLPIFDSSSNSDGDRFVRLHSAAIMPVLTIRQQRKSIRMINNKTPPTAIPIIAAEERTGESTRITRSEPIANVRTFLYEYTCTKFD